MSKLTAISITGGVGSMLISAKKQGYKVLFGTEWRPYYSNIWNDQGSTFENNFNAPLFKTLKQAQDAGYEFKDVDLVAGHTDCGNFSNLRHGSREEKMSWSFETRAGDTLEFIESIKQIKPKFFMLDNLPFMLETLSAKYWADALPEYDIFFEWISNFHYGNVQLFRKRLFVIGAKKELNYVFQPGEFEHYTSIADRINGLPEKDILELNHMHWRNEFECRAWSNFNLTGKTKDINNSQRITLQTFKDYIRNVPTKENFPYYNKKKEIKRRIGHSKIDINSYAPVIGGGGARGVDNFYRADTLNPFTVRERARIQGVPDDFIFYPLNYIDFFAEQHNEKPYVSMMKQTGKFMPVEFTTYLTQQFKDHLQGKKYHNVTHKRFLTPNEFINANKEWYCSNIGYSNKEVCVYCGNYKCTKNKKGTELIKYKFQKN